MLKDFQRILILMNTDAPVINWKPVLWAIVAIVLGYRK